MEYSTKKWRLSKECLYLKHFCDGTPNLSMVKEGKVPPALVPCPRIHTCPIRAQSVFEKGDSK